AATWRYLSRNCSRRVSASTSRSSAIAVVSVPGSHGQARSFPLGKPVDESPGPEALAVELPHGVVRVHAVRAPAVGHDIGILRQRAELASEFADRERAGAGDVPGRVLGLGPHVEDDDLAPLEPPGELLADDDLDAVPVAEVRRRQLHEASDVCGRDIPQGRPQLADAVAG